MVFWRSSVQIFKRSLKDLHLISFWDLLKIFWSYFLFLVLVKNGQKWTEDLLIKSSGNLFINLQKISLRSHEDLKNNLIEDLLNILKRTLEDIASTMSFISSTLIVRRFLSEISWDLGPGVFIFIPKRIRDRTWLVINRNFVWCFFIKKKSNKSSASLFTNSFDIFI